MKKIIVSLMVIAAITFYAQGQTRRNTTVVTQDSAGTSDIRYGKNKPHDRGDGKDLAEKLDLSADQVHQLKEINREFKIRMNELKKSGLSAADRASKKELLQQERKQKTDALLTAGQKQTLRDLKKQQAGTRKMSSAKRSGRIQEKLALSDEQVKKLDAAKQNYKDRENTIKNNSSLSADQKDMQLKALRAERKNSLSSILSAEQLKQMQELRHKQSPKSA